MRLLVSGTVVMTSSRDVTSKDGRQFTFRDVTVLDSSHLTTYDVSLSDGDVMPSEGEPVTWLVEVTVYNSEPQLRLVRALEHK